MLNYITWTADPELFHIGPFSVVSATILILVISVFIGLVIYRFISGKKGEKRSLVVKDDLFFVYVVALYIGLRAFEILPEVINIDLSVRWYGLMFAIGFWVGYRIVEKMFLRENIDLKWLEALFLYVMVGTIFGARLGHCLFYGWDYYSAHPIDILKIWEGGLASHGGAIGIVIAIYFYSKKVTHKSMLFTFDRLVVPVALVGALIRIGNLFNHEIYGHPTDLPWAFRYITNIRAWQQGAEPIFTSPSHPTQLYEAGIYLIVFALLMFLYFKKEAWKKEGLIFGIFLNGIFLTRFFVEFIKNNQEAFEENMVINMGQILSLPFIITGIWLIVRALKVKK